MTAEEFRKKLLENTVEDIVDKIILNDDPGPITTREALLSLEERIKARFAMSDKDPLSTIVVGSAKLGFSMLEKKAKKGRPYKPAYRVYVPGVSDIDVAIVSPILYGKIWKELATLGMNQHNFPWSQPDLSAYMLHGWIRPDKFPIPAPQKCSDWKKVIQEASQTKHFQYKKLRCGIYHSKFFLNIYQQRGVIAAQQAERLA